MQSREGQREWERDNTEQYMWKEFQIGEPILTKVEKIFSHTVCFQNLLK